MHKTRTLWNESLVTRTVEKISDFLYSDIDAVQPWTFEDFLITPLITLFFAAGNASDMQYSDPHRPFNKNILSEKSYVL